MTKKLWLFLVFLSLCATQVYAQCPCHEHGVDYAPMGVMGDHTHPKGHVMFSYRYQTMIMQGLKSGWKGLSTQQGLGQYNVVPEKMNMHMHMLGMMVGMHDRVTLSLMVPFIFKRMLHQTAMGNWFTVDSQGFGDFGASAQIGLIKDKSTPGQLLVLNVGATIPTHSIQPLDDTPMVSQAVLPYPMRLSSGTLDPIIGMTYTYKTSQYAVGGQLKSTLRVYDNFQNYRMGNKYQLSGWFNYGFTDIVTVSARLTGDVQGNIKGIDSRLNPAMIPTADPQAQGHVKFKSLLGVSIKPSPSVRVGLELGIPLVQHLQGIQLKDRLSMTFGTQLTY